MARAGLAPASHDGKALAHILDTFPARRAVPDFRGRAVTTSRIGILRLGERPQAASCSCASTASTVSSPPSLLRAARPHQRAKRASDIHAILAQAFNGRMSASTPAIDESALVRAALHHRPQSTGPRPQVDVRALEREIADAIRTWDDAFADALCAASWRSRRPAPLAARAPRILARLSRHFLRP